MKGARPIDRAQVPQHREAARHEASAEIMSLIGCRRKKKAQPRRGQTGRVAFGQQGTLAPDRVRTRARSILSGALDDAWQVVEANRTAFRMDGHPEEGARNALAKHIVDMAQQGERDRQRLMEGALAALSFKAASVSDLYVISPLIVAAPFKARQRLNGLCIAFAISFHTRSRADGSNMSAGSVRRSNSSRRSASSLDILLTDPGLSVRLGMEVGRALPNQLTKSDVPDVAREKLRDAKRHSAAQRYTLLSR
jgi:hypothetical protein